jgi:uncharacterized Zn-finger protein
MMIHTGEKPFACDVEGCEYRTSTLHRLKSHRLVHPDSGAAPHMVTATVASSGSVSNQTLAPTGVNPFTCAWPGCSFGFSTSNEIIAHNLGHTKPFQCTWERCDFAALDPNELCVHKCMHLSGKSTSMCDWEGCGVTLSTPAELLAHKRIHAGQELVRLPTQIAATGLNDTGCGGLIKGKKATFVD